MKTIVIVVGVREDSMNVLIPKIEKKKIQSILLVELVMLPYQEIECCWLLKLLASVFQVCYAKILPAGLLVWLLIHSKINTSSA